MKKLLMLAIAVALFCLPFAAMAEEPAVALPFGVAFGMDLETTAQTLGEDATIEEWEEAPGIGSVYLTARPLGIGDVQVSFATLSITANNSAKEPRLDSIDLSIAFEGDCIAAFHNTMEALTAVYGQPDSYAYDTYAQESYQEYGNLSISWTTPETRIYLSMYQAYSENGSVDLSYAYRLNYDLIDLEPYMAEPVG